MDAKLKILGVDDDVMCRNSLNNFSKKMPNIECTLADNGKSAIQFATDTKFDIIFMDLFMPDKNGYETTEEIRKLENGKDVHIIALSGDEVPEEDLKKFGFNAFVQKPMGKKVFESHINGFKK